MATSPQIRHVLSRKGSTAIAATTDITCFRTGPDFFLQGVDGRPRFGRQVGEKGNRAVGVAMVKLQSTRVVPTAIHCWGRINPVHESAEQRQCSHLPETVRNRNGATR